jgi:AP2 domain
MSVKKDISGQKFGRLTAVRPVGKKNGLTIWLFSCRCGGRKKTRLSQATTGVTRSCGCLNNESRARNSRAHRKHGMYDSAEFRICQGAKNRCSDPKRPNYAGKGIKFRFKSFEEFYRELGPRPTPKHTLDRIRTKEHYEPGNCRWITVQQQSWNRGKFRGNYSSKYKGVSRSRNETRWQACICQDGRKHRLGSFVSEVEAATAYDEAALIRFGPYANLNFPVEAVA